MIMLWCMIKRAELGMIYDMHILEVEVYREEKESNSTDWRPPFLTWIGNVPIIKKSSIFYALSTVRRETLWRGKHIAIQVVKIEIGHVNVHVK